MKRILRPIATLLLLLFAFNGLAYGWIDSGHMAVAFVTYRNLTPTARARVDQLIRLNPKLNEWQSMIPAGTSNANKRLMLFMIAATWADQIKSDGQHVADGPAGGNRPPHDGTADRNIGYTDTAMHKYWHFIDLPFSTDGTPLEQPEIPNARTQIAAFRQVLNSTTASDELKSYDLVWLLHIVGDIHQPLHCTARFSQQSPHGDDGGNAVKVCNPQCNNDKLHFFWDALLGPATTPAAVIPIAQALPNVDPASAANTNADDWINESFSLAKQMVYRPPIGPGNGPFTITNQYRNNARTLARKRVKLAGLRLARVLNTELR